MRSKIQSKKQQTDFRDQTILDVFVRRRRWRRWQRWRAPRRLERQQVRPRLLRRRRKPQRSDRGRQASASSCAVVWRGRAGAARRGATPEQGAVMASSGGRAEPEMSVITNESICLHVITLRLGGYLSQPPSPIAASSSATTAPRAAHPPPPPVAPGAAPRRASSRGAAPARVTARASAPRASSTPHTAA